MLGADDRVRGMWLSGSLARGNADRASDLDLVIAVADDHREQFGSEWREWLADITDTVLAGELVFLKGSFWSVTANWERFDVVVEAVSEIPTTRFPVRTLVFDRDDLSTRLPPPKSRGPLPGEVSRLVTEWFRVTAMAECILWRSDWRLAAEHLNVLTNLLLELYVEGNQPVPPMGVKKRSDQLTAEQRVTLEELPRSARSAEEFVSAHLAFSSAFLGAARPLAELVGAEWPGRVEHAAARHLTEVLGTANPYPG
ncbi:MAG TPA: nucleotidyltransferase domain-containing protein [Acidimicrobiales bacterium]|nr:nucleotidyltransferase domain-containing protein [Acidimicrobiales bacterium]